MTWKDFIKPKANGMKPRTLMINFPPIENDILDWIEEKAEQMFSTRSAVARAIFKEAMNNDKKGKK